MLWRGMMFELMLLSMIIGIVIGALLRSLPTMVEKLRTGRAKEKHIQKQQAASVARWLYYLIWQSNNILCNLNGRRVYMYVGRDPTVLKLDGEIDKLQHMLRRWDPDQQNFRWP